MSADSKLVSKELLDAVGVRKAVKLIVLGNSGVGKSFLCNVILRDQLFVAKQHTTSVTDEVESQLYQDTTGRAFVVYNVPGLLEMETANVDRNKKCIKEAFEGSADLDADTIVLFVFSQNGGRLSPDDLAAFKALSEYLEVEANKFDASIGLLVNGLKKDEIEEEVEGGFEGYMATVTRTLRQLCAKNAKGGVYFAENVPKASKQSFTSAPMEALRATLLQAMVDLVPAKMQPPEDRKIELQRDKLVSQINELKKESLALQQRHQDDMAKHTAAHTQALAEVRSSNERAMQTMREDHAREMRSLEAEMERKSSSDMMPLLAALLMGHQQALASAPPPPMMMMSPGMMSAGGPTDAGPTGRAPTSAGPAAAGGGMSWNQFRTAHAGQGLSSRGTGPGTMSHAYSAYKNGQ